ncbi:MAG: CvpA family protein [Saprospiraceae bacterium]|nr:CvpA family protein [Saprospiraceae bacterium]MCB0676447.1 CvpA family protein [Saprospiraceae bacterium]MCB0683467.1 CvpA family protein [Saprospiraceae bacterium]
MVIDIIFVIMAGYGFYLGFAKGIIRTIFTILSFLFGLLAAFKFAPAATKFLETAFDSNNPMMFLAGFLLSFVLTMILIRLVARAIEGFLRTANINIVNQFAGGLLLAGMMTLLYSMVLWFGTQSKLIDEQTKSQSFTYTYLQHYPDRVWAAIKFIQPSVREFWDDSIDFMDQLRDRSMEQTDGEPNIFDIDDEEESSEPTSNR